MIAERSTGLKVEGNITGDSYKAGVDDEDMAHIINLFTDLYSDQEMAVIREYSTNARDAHIEAGVPSLPIQVTLPSNLSPQFMVEDFGVGLHAEDIQKVYSRYGKSTKRATNDQNGMLGLGCKSALTYSQQFTVESAKDGTLTICMIARGDDGVPIFTVVSSVPTDRRNGTRVVVPARRYNEFERKAAQFFQHWEPGTVLVNGHQPKPLQGALKLSDGLLLVKDTGYGSSRVNHVVMGGVAYPVTPDRLNTSLPYGYTIVAHVPIGAVNFTPSRESLMYTTRTKETLAALPAKIKAAVEKAVQAEVEHAASPRAAVQALIKWGELVSNTQSFKYKGKDLPVNMPGVWVLSSRNSRKMGHSSKSTTVHVEAAMSGLFVTGYDPSQFTAQHKRKLIQYCDDNSLTAQTFIMTPNPSVDMTWIDASQVAKWEDVRKVVLPRNSPVWRNGRPTGAYDGWAPGAEVTSHIQADEIDTSEDIFYFRGMNSSEAYRYAAPIRKGFPDATLVCVPENRFAKFQRFFPEAKHYREAIQASYDNWLNSLSKGARIGMAVQEHCDTSWLNRLDPTKVDDPALRRAIHIYRNTKKSVDAAQRARQQFSYVMGAVKDPVDKFRDPLKSYPLLPTIRTYGLGADVIREITLYLNASYAARKAA